jgi:hypothetical protein
MDRVDQRVFMPDLRAAVFIKKPINIFSKQGCSSEDPCLLILRAASVP